MTALWPIGVVVAAAATAVVIALLKCARKTRNLSSHSRRAVANLRRTGSQSSSRDAVVVVAGAAPVSPPVNVAVGGDVPPWARVSPATGGTGDEDSRTPVRVVSSESSSAFDPEPP